MKHIRKLRPSAAMVIAVLALVIGLESPAMAHQANVVAHKISGSSIKKHSIAGNRLKNNTLTGKQIKESTLGTVPSATTAGRANSLPALTWHTITHFQNGWGNYSDSEYPPAAYAVDAQGIVHMRGAIAGGSSANSVAFDLPSSVVSSSRRIDVPDITTGDVAGCLTVFDDGVLPNNSGGGSGSAATSFTGLDGITFAAG